MPGVALPLCPPDSAAAPRVAEAPALFRPRRPERTVFYRLLDEHFEAYTRVHSERYAPRHGDLRPVVRRCVVGAGFMPARTRSTTSS